MDAPLKASLTLSLSTNIPMALRIFTLVLLLSVWETMGVKVITPDVSLPPMSAPPPTSGGELSPGPSRGWGWVSSTPSKPSPAPDAFPVVPKERTPSSPSPSGSPGGGDGIPFISSNPAVPLPTGMTDTATIRPLPTPGDRNQVVGMGSVARVQKALLVSAMMFSAALIMWM